MAGGWSRDGAIQAQIDASIKEAIDHARNQIPAGNRRTHCKNCAALIPVTRREAIPGVCLCIECQQAVDEQQSFSHGINRRGSKNSQLR